MSWTAIANQSKKVVYVSGPELNREDLFNSIKNYLLSINHEKLTLENKLEKLTSKFENYWDYECDAIQAKLDKLDNAVAVYDANNEKVMAYRVDYGIVRKTIDKYEVIA